LDGEIVFDSMNGEDETSEIVQIITINCMN